MAASRISHLASMITDSTTKFEKCLESHNLPSPSFDPSTSSSLPPSVELQGAQTALLEAVAELQALVVGPTWMLRSICLMAR